MAGKGADGPNKRQRRDAAAGGDAVGEHPKGFGFEGDFSGWRQRVAAPSSTPPEGFMFHWSLPDVDEREYDPDSFIDAVRQMASEGADHIELQSAYDDGDGMELGAYDTVKSYGVDEDYWTKGTDAEQYSEENLKKQFPDEWCASLTRDAVVAMYFRLYGGPEKVDLLPAGAQSVADDLVQSMSAAGDRLDMHDERRVAPLLESLRALRDLASADGSADQSAFEHLSGVMLGLDASRGDCGLNMVIGNSGQGDIVADIAGVGLVAAAWVLGSMHRAGKAGAPGTPARRAFKTTLKLRDNLSQSGSSDCSPLTEVAERMEERLKKLAEIVDGEEKGEEDEDQDEKKPKQKGATEGGKGEGAGCMCTGVRELNDALAKFTAMHLEECR